MTPQTAVLPRLLGLLIVRVTTQNPPPFASERSAINHRTTRNSSRVMRFMLPIHRHVPVASNHNCPARDVFLRATAPFTAVTDRRPCGRSQIRRRCPSDDLPTQAVVPCKVPRGVQEGDGAKAVGTGEPPRKHLAQMFLFLLTRSSCRRYDSQRSGIPSVRTTSIPRLRDWQTHKSERSMAFPASLSHNFVTNAFHTYGAHIALAVNMLQDACLAKLQLP